MSFETTVPYKAQVNKFDTNAKEEEVLTLKQVANLIEERVYLEKRYWSLLSTKADIQNIMTIQHSIDIIDNRLNRWRYTGSDNPV
jgi:hypothetical protein